MSQSSLTHFHFCSHPIPFWTYTWFDTRIFFPDVPGFPLLKTSSYWSIGHSYTLSKPSGPCHISSEPFPPPKWKSEKLCFQSHSNVLCFLSQLPPIFPRAIPLNLFCALTKTFISWCGTQNWTWFPAIILYRFSPTSWSLDLSPSLYVA